MTKTKAKKKEKLLPESVRSGAHREWGITDDHAEWCREVVNFDDRQDAVPVLNGARLGQHWRNIHTGEVRELTEIRLAGIGCHTAHYESIVLVDEGGPSAFFDSGWALWSLYEHWELVEREGDEWGRVEPQPFLWKSRDDADYDESTICSRVKHHRPKPPPRVEITQAEIAAMDPAYLESLGIPRKEESHA